jgi:pimeloyl-ACP methyl ester carboxylesterase
MMTNAMHAERLPGANGAPALHVAVQRVADRGAPDVLYIHGATFPSALSIFFRFDGVSWADALNRAGFNAWGLDFAGYGESERPAAMREEPQQAAPIGRAGEAAAQIRRAVEHIRCVNGGARVHLIAHSWGTTAAGRFAADHPELVGRIVLFGPITERRTHSSPPFLGAWRFVNVWEQYRRLIEDVPRGHAPVLSDAHMDAWARAYLASDAESGSRTPPAVKTPNGPLADIFAAWSGMLPYDPGAIRAPVLIVRGEWDSLSTDADVAALLGALRAAPVVRDVKIAQGTHLLHLERHRGALYAAASDFLRESAPVRRGVQRASASATCE